MQSEPLISVCIPCYNGEQFIAETLESVLNQDLTNFEIIVVDDASTDRTLSVLEGFTDSRIRLIRNERNLGMGNNWNKALSYSRGKYVKLLCEDDLLHSECLTRQAGILDNHVNSQAVLAICNRNIINHRSEVVLKGRPPVACGLINGRELVRKSIRRGTNLIGEPAVGLFRRDALTKGAVCDPSNPFLSDMSLWSELLRSGDAFVDPECLASFRISEQAATARIGLRQVSSFRAFARKIYKDSFYRIGLLDLASGCLLSFSLCLLRNAFIKARARSGSAGSQKLRFRPGPDHSSAQSKEQNRMPVSPTPTIARV